ncbi:hypothetical protein [Burkholderia cenocepacia]|uniref:hypothetical protein n=1 Tax=Burkholderia cenocepacia TaxID=95486 RepID=UPI001C0DEF19|nr:hypothetical protein [Burkholderia cenocepacia]MDN7541690.1 hypothetical protein [Burkholderia cenocepacia]
MKCISRLRVGVGVVVPVAIMAAVQAKVVWLPMDSYLAYRERAAAEVNARLDKFDGAVRVKGFPVKVRGNVQSVLADDGMTPGPMDYS